MKITDNRSKTILATGDVIRIYRWSGNITLILNTDYKVVLEKEEVAEISELLYTGRKSQPHNSTRSNKEIYPVSKTKGGIIQASLKHWITFVYILRAIYHDRFSFFGIPYKPTTFNPLVTFRRAINTAWFFRIIERNNDY